MSEQLGTNYKKRSRLVAAAATSALLFSVSGCEDSGREETPQTTTLELTPVQRDKIDRAAAQYILGEVRYIDDEIQFRKSEGVKETGLFKGTNLTEKKNSTHMLEGDGDHELIFQRRVSDSGADRLVVVEGWAAEICPRLEARMVVENSHESLDDLSFPAIKSFLGEEDTHLVRAADSCGNTVDVDENAVLSGRYPADSYDYDNKTVPAQADELMKFALSKLNYFA